MQQATPMVPMMPSFPPSNITTEQIQKYLDDNKKLILAIMENQNLGKLAECAQYQAQLQKNLMYLAAIADAQPQPQTPTIPSQITPHPVMQQGGFYLQHPQAAAMAQQHPIFSQKTPPQFNPPHPMQDHHHQQQQAIQGQMSMRLGGPHNPTHPASSGAATLPAPVGPSDVRGGNKKDAPDSGAGASGTDGQGGSAAGGVETSYPKGSEGAK